MDSGTKIKREKNPKANANLFSKLLFIFAIKTLRKGFGHDLKENDIYEIMENYRSEKLGKRIEELWKLELKKSNPSILLCLVKMFGMEYSILAVAFFFYEFAVLIIQPILTGKLVSYFEPNTPITQNEAIMYMSGILTCILTFSILDHTYFIIVQQICLRAKIALSALVYRKSLKLNLFGAPEFACGMAVTLITKDVMQFDTPLDFGYMFFNGFFRLIIMTILMYRQIGVSALVSSSFLLIFIPTQIFLGYRILAYRIRTSTYTDQRFRVTQEILTAIRIIKMYTWELFFLKFVNKLRRKELKILRIVFLLKALATSIGQLSSRIAFYLCVMTYLALGNHITTEKAFFITGTFAAINVLFTIYIPVGVGQLSELKASLNRLTSFLLLDEVPLDMNLTNREDNIHQILIENVTIQTNQSLILDDINLEIRSGLTILTGATGSGKSTILKLILGDTKVAKGKIQVLGNISYASQEPWLFPGSIKQNIIFGEKYDQERYEEVIEVCALKTDFRNLPNGDQTSLTDKGLNLSRGQKTRINLARSVYRKSDIYLFDDCFSAVDGLVRKQIFSKCIKQFLANKLCVLVSNQNKLLSNADRIIVLNEGVVQFNGSYENLIQWDDQFQTENENERTIEKIDKIEEDKFNHLLPTFNDMKITSNIYSEDSKDGFVNKQVFFEYIKHGGGITMVILLLVVSIISQVASSWADYFVSFWVDMEQELSGFRYNRSTHSVEFKELKESHKDIMLEYSFVILGAITFTILTALVFFIFASKASVNIHVQLLKSVLNAKMKFFDTNLSGNVLNRFSRDLGIIDEQMPFVIYYFTNKILALLGTLFVVTSVNIYFLAPSVIIVAILFLLRRFYLPTGRSLRRLEGSSRSPIVGHLNATLEGLTTIRASKSQDILLSEYDKHQNVYNSASYMYINVTQAFSFYMDILSSIYICVITFTFLFCKTESTAGKIGLAITQSFSVVSLLQFCFRTWTELEIQMTSTERVIEYIKTKPEDQGGNKVVNWPKTGKIVYEDVNIRYSSSAEPVLKNLSFTIEPHQKVGIVGRTGAGKSSIVSALFRLYDFEGKITIDDVDINSMQISFLRSKISIIPQDPVLFSGTLRSNLDPNGEFSDKELWNALEEVKIKSLIKNLNITISEGGLNFSIGQRQLLCLARALIHKNTILVLDEATANLDTDTDTFIQNTIKTTFSHCTVISIAHRLNTILHCDKVLVMDLGKAIEFDNPQILLSNKNGMFYKMASEAGLVI